MLAPRAQAPLVADAQGQPVRVVALEQQLRGAARDAESVAEAGEGNRLQRRERLAAALVEVSRDSEAVADASQGAAVLEESGQVAVVDSHQVFRGEPRLELRGRRRVVAERGRGSRRV